MISAKSEALPQQLILRVGSPGFWDFLVGVGKKHGISWKDLVSSVRREKQTRNLSFLSLGWSAERVLRRLQEVEPPLSKRDALWLYGPRLNEDRKTYLCTVAQLKPGQDRNHRAILREENFSIVIVATDGAIEGTPQILCDRSDIVVFDGTSSTGPNMIDAVRGFFGDRKLAEQTPCFLTHRRSTVLLPMFGVPMEIGQLAHCIDGAAKDEETFGTFLRSVVASRFLPLDELVVELDKKGRQDSSQRLREISRQDGALESSPPPGKKKRLAGQKSRRP
jgi:hypothetical protein